MAKKILALVLAVMMIAALSVSAFADDVQAGEKGLITISNSAAGETYAVYKIFDLTYVEETAEDSDADEAHNKSNDPTINEDVKVAYTYNKPEGDDALYTALMGADSPFKLTPMANVTAGGKGTYNVELAKKADDEYFTGVEIGNWLKTNIDKLGDPVASEEGNDGDLKFEVSYGYYFITTTQGTLVTVNSTLPNVTVIDKTEKPTIDKYVWETSTFTSEGEINQATPDYNWTIPSDGQATPGANWGTRNDASIGDTVFYADVIHAKSGATNYKVTDTLDEGLVLTGLVEIKDYNGTVSGSYYKFTPDEDNYGFTVTFSKEYLDQFYNDQKAAPVRINRDIVIFYTAMIEDEVVADTAYKNTFSLSFGSAGTADVVTKAETETYVWDFDAIKVNEKEEPLAEADFVLYTNPSCTDEYGIKLDKRIDHKLYRFIGLSDGTTITTDSDGKFNVYGLDSGTYYLKEVDSPAGYKLLEEPVTITISSDGSYTATYKEEVLTPGSDGIVIKNSTGVELPATGGIGTTIFYVVGSICVVGAAVLLLSKKRVRG